MRGEARDGGREVATVNAAARVADCAPVLTVTARGPGGAAASIPSCATAVVALDTVTGPAAPSAAPPTEIPAPKLATVEPCTKLVYAPVIVTDKVWPGDPVFGAIERICAAGFTVRLAVLELANAAFVVVAPLIETA